MPRVTLDWKAYFRNFEAVHGGNPVRYGGRLLYHDGWSYSATDHAGPEFPPPPGDIRPLVHTYYRLRKRALEREYEELSDSIRFLTELQDNKSAPLQQRVRYYDEARGWVSEAVDVDLLMMKQQLAVIEQQITECKGHLGEQT